MLYLAKKSVTASIWVYLFEMLSLFTIILKSLCISLNLGDMIPCVFGAYSNHNCVAFGIDIVLISEKKTKNILRMQDIKVAKSR